LKKKKKKKKSNGEFLFDDIFFLFRFSFLSTTKKEKNFNVLFHFLFFFFLSFGERRHSLVLSWLESIEQIQLADAAARKLVDLAAVVVDLSGDEKRFEVRGLRDVLEDWVRGVLLRKKCVSLQFPLRIFRFLCKSKGKKKKTSSWKK
jgi:hypothetical protein